MLPSIGERFVHALEYVAQLQRVEPSLIFTGGTAAQLLVGAVGVRLSRDVDVISYSDEARWTGIVASVAASFGGEVYAAKPDLRQHGGSSIKAIHYIVSFPSALDGSEADIELDVWFPSRRIASVPTSLQAHIYEPKIATTVPTPTGSALTALKLCTLGPETTGLARGEKLPLALAKQVFDLDKLLSLSLDWRDLADTFKSMQAEQSSYRPRAYTTAETLDDAWRLLSVIGASAPRQAPDQQWRKDFEDLKEANARLHDYIRRGSFDRPTWFLAVGRIALAIALIRRAILRGENPTVVGSRWNTYAQEIPTRASDQQEVQAALRRLAELNPKLRPHLWKKDQISAGGATSFLYWDAAVAEWT